MTHRKDLAELETLRQLYTGLNTTHNAVKLENVTLKQRLRDAQNLLADAVGGLCSPEELVARFHIWLGIDETMEQLCDDEPTVRIDTADLCGVTEMHTTSVNPYTQALSDARSVVVLPETEVHPPSCFCATCLDAGMHAVPDGSCLPEGPEGQPCAVETRDDLNDSDEFEVTP